MSTIHPTPAHYELADGREGEPARPAHPHEHTCDPLIDHLRPAPPSRCHLPLLPHRCCHTAPATWARLGCYYADDARRGEGGRRPRGLPKGPAPPPRKTPRAAPAPPLATLRYGAARAQAGPICGQVNCEWTRGVTTPLLLMPIPHGELDQAHGWCGEKFGCCVRENDGRRDSRAVVCKEGPGGGSREAIPGGVMGGRYRRACVLAKDSQCPVPGLPAPPIICINSETPGGTGTNVTHGSHGSDFTDRKNARVLHGAIA